MDRPPDDLHEWPRWLRRGAFIAVPTGVVGALRLMGYETPAGGAVVMFLALAWGAWAILTWPRVGAALKLRGRWAVRIARGVAGLVVVASSLVAYALAPNRPAELTTTPCGQETNNAPLPPPQNGSRITFPGSRFRGTEGLRMEVRAIRADRYLDPRATSVGPQYALCGSLYMVNNDTNGRRVSLRFEFFQVTKKGSKVPRYITHVGNGVQTFNIRSNLGPGEDTTGYFRVPNLTLDEAEGRDYLRALFARETLSDSWAFVPAPGVYPDDVLAKSREEFEAMIGASAARDKPQ